MDDVTVPIEDLRAAGYGEEVENVATAVAGYLDDGVGQNVAIVSDPYAGRDALLEYAESLLDGEVVRVDLDPSAADGTGPSLPDGSHADPRTDAEHTDPQTEGGNPDSQTDGAHADTVQSVGHTGGDSDTAGASSAGEGGGALLVADAHSLFERRIDGFDALDAFLERIALSDALVVTAWNRYAWSYLDAVRDVGDTFQTHVEIPPHDADEIQTVVETHFGPDRPEVVDTGSAGRVKTVVFDSHPVKLPRGRSLSIPYPKPNPAWLASWSVSGETESVEAVVFEKLRRVSSGNPGVALAVWRDSIEDGQIAPGHIDAFEADRTFDDDTALILWTVVAVESIPVHRLADTFEDRPVERVLQDLSERGFVAVEDGTVRVVPQALHAAIAGLERRGLLW